MIPNPVTFLNHKTILPFRFQCLSVFHKSINAEVLCGLYASSALIALYERVRVCPAVLGHNVLSLLCSMLQTSWQLPFISEIAACQQCCKYFSQNICGSFVMKSAMPV